jgi:formamidopyrimidine-DNA glycosylase
MAIKAVFLDQSRFVQGIGNYLADEVCHAARVDPNTGSSLLSNVQWADLSQAATDCFGVFAKARGTALKDEGWKDLFGQLGAGGDLLKVHAKTSCGTCFGPVSKGKIAGRSSYWCQACQPAITAM